MNVVNFGSKQCERIRGQLDAYLSNELLVETTGEVLKHLETCPPCSAEAESRMRVREALRKAVEKQAPPERLGDTVRSRLRKTERGNFWQASATWVVAAGLALVVLAGAAGEQYLKFRHNRHMVAAVLTLGVSDHLHCAIKGHNYPEVTNPPEQLREKLGAQYAGLLPVVERKLAGFEVLEAHVCSVPGSPRKYVHFIARGHGTILSVILTRRDGESLPTGRVFATRASGSVDLYQSRLEGFSVVSFEANEYFGFVVSDLGTSEVSAMAAALGPALRNASETTIARTILEPARSRIISVL